MLHQMLVVLVLVIICCGQEFLTCTRRQTPHTSSLQTTQRGKKGPMGLKGDKGEPGTCDNSEINTLKEQVKTLQNQVQAMLSEKLPSNCSEIYASNRTSGFYKTSSDSFKCNCKMELCDLSSAAQGNFVRIFPNDIPFDSIRGHAVVITGRPTLRHEIFSIDFNTRISGEMPFHFKKQPRDNSIVRNTQQNYSWGTEEKSLDIPYPFADNRDFKLKISVDSQGFHVFLNNEHLLDYDHRYRQISDIQMIDIVGSIEVYRLWFE